MTQTYSIAADALLRDPVEAFVGSYTQMESIDRVLLDRLHLDCLRQRFAELRDRIPTLKKLADRQAIDGLDASEDVIPLLFDHAVYKSYPSQLIDLKRFGNLTTWLGRLTTHDLDDVDVSRCQSLDEWLATLDEQTELRVCHSSGTSGTMSFLPWSGAELANYISVMGIVISQTFGEDEDWRARRPVDVIFPYFRHGGGMHTRQNDVTERLVAQGPERFHALYPERVSSDVLHLSARLRDATARGQAHTVSVDEHLLARKQEFERMLAEMPKRVDEFLEQAVPKLRGRRIQAIGSPQMFTQMAEAGLAKGVRSAFAPDSVIAFAGGGKGWTPPLDWKGTVLEFFGASELRSFYGMSEIALIARRCGHGKYHVNPWIVPFILDPDTSKPLPREGSTTGRAAFFDLLATTRWGGFVSGDEVTLDWEMPCPCGRTTVYLDDDIQRISEKRGGDDKITCVATPEAQHEALSFLNAFEGF
jgi:hypothetical protein